MGITGDEFEEFYQDYWRIAYTVCRSRLGNDEEALDTTQEVFIRKWQARDRYDPRTSTFRTWLIRNAINACIDKLRLRARRPAEVELEEEDQPLLPAPDSAATRHVILSRCLATLSAEERDLVLMHAVEEYTWLEIAAITGFTISQVRTRTASALKTLRNCLTRSGIDAPF